MTAPTPPYTVKTLPKAPLSPTIRQAMLAWIASTSWGSGNGPYAGLPTNISDSDLLVAYKAGLQNLVPGQDTTISGNPVLGPTVGAVSSATESVGSFLGKLSNGSTWVRVAEFAIGGIMLAIAINALVKNTTGVDPGGAASKVTRLSPVGAIANKKSA